ncbi:MAG: peptide deformylase [Verrucomicrobiota bacterium]
MILPVLKYGHPMLRQKGARIAGITLEIKTLVADMLETMRAARGVGLAAQQVGYALQLTVIDVREATERPSTLHVNGQPADVHAFMPVVLINPAIKPVGEPATGPEGCLSFPEMYADITRPESVDVRAVNESGQPIAFRCGGLLSRAIQHEYDHLQGILFIDRMSAEKRRELKAELDELRATTKADLRQLAKA